MDALCSSFMWCVGDVWCIYGVCSIDAFASLRLWKFHNGEILGELVTLSDTLYRLVLFDLAKLFLVKSFITETLLSVDKLPINFVRSPQCQFGQSVHWLAHLSLPVVKHSHTGHSYTEVQ